jgi:hypothetical protein
MNTNSRRTMTLVGMGLLAGTALGLTATAASANTTHGDHSGGTTSHQNDHGNGGAQGHGQGDHDGHGNGHGNGDHDGHGNGNGGHDGHGNGGHDGHGNGNGGHDGHGNGHSNGHGDRDHDGRGRDNGRGDHDRRGHRDGRDVRGARFNSVDWRARGAGAQASTYTVAFFQGRNACETAGHYGEWLGEWDDSACMKAGHGNVYALMAVDYKGRHRMAAAAHHNGHGKSNGHGNSNGYGNGHGNSNGHGASNGHSNGHSKYVVAASNGYGA